MIVNSVKVVGLGACTIECTFFLLEETPLEIVWPKKSRLYLFDIFCYWF